MPSKRGNAGPVPGKAAGEIAGLDPLLKKLMAHFRQWANTTDSARLKWRRDYELTEGNGKQWADADRLAVRRSGRPALEFNQILQIGRAHV